MKLPALEVHLLPAEPILLAHAHPGMNREHKMGQELLEATFDGGAETLLLSIGQEPDPSAPLRFLADAGRRVPIDLLVIHSNPEDQRKGCLPAVPGRARPLALLGLLRQPIDNLVLADRIGRPRSKHG